MLCNEENAFPVIVKVGDQDVTAPLVLEALRSALLAQGYEANHIEQFLEAGKSITFTPFRNASIMSRLERLFTTASSLDMDILQAGKILAEQVVMLQKKRIIPSEMMGIALETEHKETGRLLHETVRLHITLRLSRRFKVFRDFSVPTSITFGQLHEIVQIGFGWDDMHLHVFKIGKCIKIGTPSDDFGIYGDFEETIDEHTIRLDGLSPQIKKITYLYDFGDGWMHTITLGKRLMQAEEPFVVCIGGSGDAPWEDCGGPYGYEEMVDILSDPDNEQYENIADWTGGSYSNKFNLDLINRQLAEMS